MPGIGAASSSSGAFATSVSVQDDDWNELTSIEVRTLPDVLPAAGADPFTVLVGSWIWEIVTVDFERFMEVLRQTA